MILRAISLILFLVNGLICALEMERFIGNFEFRNSQFEINFINVFVVLNKEFNKQFHKQRTKRF